MSSITIPSPYQETTFTSRYLDWAQRPDSLKSEISNAFRKIVGHSSSKWGAFNGSKEYNMCGVKEHALMKKIIQRAPKEQKEFYVLDIGAGDFQWSKGMADFIDKQTDLPKDIKVHIIGIRGEGYFGDRIIETERCKIYNLGAFKVEELFERFKDTRFKELGLDHLESKIDLAISRWCLRHLVDPVGVVAQVYNLLRPNTGHFLIDGFFFLLEKDDIDHVDHNALMTRLFMDIKAPFLTQYNEACHSLNHFILRRPDDTFCRIPMSYLDTCGSGDGRQIGSGRVTQFHREDPSTSQETIHVPVYSEEQLPDMYGDKKMHDWLKKNGLLVDPGSSWKPLVDEDNHLAIPALHRAVQQEERDQVEACLKNRDDIDESDSLGCTALHIAIRKNSFVLFKLLLDQGANFGLSNQQGNTPMHEAAALDTEGFFLQELINVGAEVNIEVRWKTPLCRAIEAKNLKAIEILIRAGAKISEENDKDLENSVFAPLHAQEIIPKMKKKRGRGGFTDLQRWVEKGDYVVLHYNGSNGITYHYPHSLNKNPKLKFININPEFKLLDDGEWPGFLRAAGYEYRRGYDAEEVKKLGFKSCRKYNFAYDL